MAMEQSKGKKKNIKLKGREREREANCFGEEGHVMGSGIFDSWVLDSGHRTVENSGKKDESFC